MIYERPHRAHAYAPSEPGHRDGRPPFEGPDLFIGRPAVPLFAWADTSFSRSGATTGFTSPSSLANYSANVRRYNNLGDGMGDMLSIQASHTNRFPWSQPVSNFSDSANNSTVSANNIASPTGSLAASRVVMSGVTSHSRRADLGAVAAVPYATSLWAKAAPGSEGAPFRFASLHTLTDDPLAVVSAKISGTLSATWVRYTAMRLPSGTSSTSYHAYRSTVNIPDSGDPSISPYTVDAWGHHNEENWRYVHAHAPTSGSAATVGADVATLASASVPAVMRSGRWAFYFRPVFASTDLVSGNIRLLWAFADADNVIRIRHDGTNVIFEVVVSASAVLSQAFTFPTAQPMRAVVDAAAGTVTLSGATTGNGVISGTPWTMPSGDVGVGRVPAVSGNEADCDFSIPIAA